MTSRDRLLRTMRREPVDRVPISTYELAGYNPDSFENKAPSYRRLMDRIRAETDSIYMWSWEPWPDSALWEHHCDEAPDGTTVTHSRLRTPKGDLTKTTQVRPNVHTVWTTEHLLKDAHDIDRFLAILPELYRVDEAKVRAARESHALATERVADHGIVMADGGDPSSFVPDLFEFGLFTLMCFEHHDKILELIDAFTKPVLDVARVNAECGFGPMVRLYGPEYYTPPYLPPSYFEEMVLPGLTETTRILRDAGIFVRLHCHGRIREALPMIVASGAQGTDPIEPPPDGNITLREVKELYGDRLVLFGNTELKLLEQGTPEQIDAVVREQMDAAKAGGGYVLMSTASPINEPLSPLTGRNYFAWIEAGHKYGVY